MKFEVWFEPNGDSHYAQWKLVEAGDPAQAIRVTGRLATRRPQDNIYAVNRKGKVFACVPANLRYGQTLKNLGYQQISL